MTTTLVHVVRHGEVHNPQQVLYGRLPGFHLSELGLKMAERVAESLAGRDITAVVASPLERALETAAPIAAAFDCDVDTDPRLIEAANHFEGKTFGVGDGSLRRPEHWRYLWNPFRPSWGEAYAHIAARMLLAIDDAREAARGHEALIVSHQLPVWIARKSYEKGRFAHDPRNRQCSLASLTTLTFEDDAFKGLVYSEPAGHLIPDALRGKFVGGA